MHGRGNDSSDSNMQSLYSLVDRLVTGDAVAVIETPGAIHSPRLPLLDGPQTDEQTEKARRFSEEISREQKERELREARERKERELRGEQRREEAAWWDPWLAAWRQIGEEVAHPRARSHFLELIAARFAQLDVARERRLAEAVDKSKWYPICRSCGHRMASREHRCLP